MVEECYGEKEFQYTSLLASIPFTYESTPKRIPLNEIKSNVT